MTKNQWYVLRESTDAIYHIKESMVDTELLVAQFETGVIEVLTNLEVRYADRSGFYRPRGEMIVKIMLIEK
jgi:hypothetical protein